MMKEANMHDDHVKTWDRYNRHYDDMDHGFALMSATSEAWYYWRAKHD